MKTRGLVWMLVPVVAMAWGLTGTAQAQYQVPLRYDLRYSSPTYIPSDVMRGVAPPSVRQDPYAFGSLSYGNLAVTGNLRAGKSFQGNIPYIQTGAILSKTLPSFALDKFERDSIGVGDIGTGVERGVPTPYFPSSGTVTTPASAGVRFITPPMGERAPYTLPNLNTVLPQTGVRAGVDAMGLPGQAEGAVQPGQGLVIPQSALNWVDALIEGRISPEAAGVTGGEEASKKDPRLGLLQELPDQRLGLKPETAAAPPQAPEPQAEPQAIEETQQSLYQAVRKEAEEAIREEQSKPKEPAEASSVQPQPGRQEQVGPPEEETPPGIPPPAKPYASAGGFDGHMKRADAAMKDSNYGMAEALYAAAAALEPSRSAAFFGRLQAMLGLMYYDQAGLVLERTIKAHPDWVGAAPDITSVYFKSDVLERIITDLKANLLVKPDSLSDGLLLGYVLYSAGRRDEAKTFLEAGVRTRGDEQGAEQVILKAMEGR